MRLFPTAVLALLIAAPLAAQQAGLGNATRDFTPPAEIAEADWTDPAEMQRAWAAALVRVPTDPGTSVQTRIADLPDLLAGRDPLPTVIYLHGCAGFWDGTHARLRFLADNGFLVIAPASLARARYAQSCDPATRRGGLYRPVLKMRQADAGHAIEQARALPFVDPGRIVLMGLSEGAITTATFAPANDRQRVAVRVIEGWTCHAGWGEYAGLNAPRDEAVLALVAGNDPWFRHPSLRGECGRWMSRHQNSKSVVYDSGTLATRHGLLEFDAPQAEVLAFLRARLNLP